MENVKIESFEDYKQKYQFNKYEQTSCMIYEMYIRAEGIKSKSFDENEKLAFFSDVPRIKDIYLYSSNEESRTLQNVIYNIYPDIYIDALIWIIQYHIFQQINYIKSNLVEIKSNLLEMKLKEKINTKEEIDTLQKLNTFFDDFEVKINPDNNKLEFYDKYFSEITMKELVRNKDLIDNQLTNLEKKINKDYEIKFVINKKDEIIKDMNYLSDYSFEEFKDFSIKLNNHLSIKEFSKYFNLVKTNFICMTESVDNIIGNIISLNQELQNYTNENTNMRDIDLSGLSTVIRDDLKLFSFPLEYLKENYLDNEKKIFNRQVIENHYDRTYIRLTKTYVKELIDNHILNLRFTPNYKRPLNELQHISKLTTLHNINLSLPLDELTAHIEKMKESYYYNLNVEESLKYKITHFGGKVDTYQYFENLEDCIRILYIYDNSKNNKVSEIYKELSIGRNKYYILKEISNIYIKEKKYKELYSK